MKCTVLVMLALATLVAVGAAQVTFLDTPVADKNQDQGRNVTGQVMTKAETPLPDAVVYLKNTKTLTIKSFITEKDGGYRFHGLSPNIDYEIYADYQGQKSGTKTISSFDNRNNITLNIRIDTRQ
ncbi:MAG: carboxypeptidase regulatory-like domain-containing protein [Acidobacteria bacterium]|nr:MAG: carboxypeptidase regulatory-like domain-containing protein [Acidobacteriota bacterium]PYY03577.1 MAG: carboxypeptidase regulatory-like domain-containing protein [Acidobacteriota bacterium]PYY21469.1 MAG: carboxypeptidase regulatory-like domain-containing protein [Acidobacteriota bacterium]